MAKRATRRGRIDWQRAGRYTAAAVIVLIGLYAVGATVAGPLFWYPCSLDGLSAHGPAQASVLYYSNGTQLGTLGATSNRLPVPLTKISPLMQKAIIDTEDQRFYSNEGIDFIGIIRSLKADVFAGGAVQGGSTIEQQLVRNLYLTPQQSLTRKLTEACLAIELDRKWSKDRVLAEYLNDIYFGQQAYGIQAAAHTYFSEPASKLTLDQAAVIAGLPQAPSAYDPIVNPDAARRRRNEVLQAMLSAGDISESRYRKAIKSPLGVKPARSQSSSAGTYLADYITAQLVREYGASRVRQGGLKVYTTLDARKQIAASESVLGTLNANGDPAGAVVSIDPDTGDIRAMAAAQTGQQISFDIPADAQRQAGSTFKMFVLTEAVIRGINPFATQYLSAPFTGPNNWQVATYEHTYSGRIPISQATIESDNTVYARMTLDLGPQPIADLAQSMGIDTKLEAVPSIGLGVNGISPLDLASAYATLAAGGIARTPTILDKVAFPDGHTENAVRPSGHRVLDPKVASVVTQILEANVQSGTGTAAALPGRPVAGKTGTTDNSTDAWFAGWVPQLATVVWVGQPKGETPLGTVHGIPAVTGGSFPAMIWHTYMSIALTGEPVVQFADPGAPPYHRWCGRYQFALTWRNARPDNNCPTKPETHSTSTKTDHKTTTTVITTITTGPGNGKGHGHHETTTTTTTLTTTTVPTTTTSATTTTTAATTTTGG
ncbi:MAG: penicillin-binding protein [Gaiellaceae bacterium]|jgi:penicillin-binding protein 1A|nr:penicillin-binding protein [Gaiellaceae bacterium]